MKLDKIKFASLVGFISCRYALTITQDDMHEIDNLIDIDVPQPEQIYPNASLVTDLLVALRDQKKIDAIRAHRAMTGMGLKESKDEVEKYWKNDTAWTKAEMKGKINLLAHSDDADTIISFIESL